MFIPKGSSIEFGHAVDRALPVRRLACELAIAMKDFITEAWLRANHTLSEGAEIHLPADARLTPSARELLESPPSAH
ncbi:ATP:Cob(I)alamin adenosyltransferase [Klebsiella michiganensis]|nr:ATP:Cob(I)alamin adenosyltransferase [Klebsiella michiganensis]